MRLRLLLFAILFLSFGRVPAQTLQPANQTSEKGRIERLVGLAKIWGTIKYFHPFLAYREIDWDKALIEAIPRVNAAKTPQEYETAINLMLEALGDKTTRARIGGEKQKAGDQSTPIQTNDPLRLEKGVLMIDAFAVAKVFRQEANRRDELITKTSQLIPQAKAIEIDLLHGGQVDTEGLGYFLNTYLQAISPAMLDRNVSLGSVRCRIHNGYVPQTGSTSGGYYSALVTTTPETLAGNNKAKTPPIVFLTDENSPAVEMLGALQAAKLAFVVQDGSAPTEAGAILTTIKLPDNVEVKMRTAERVNTDGSIGFAADQIAPKGEAVQTAHHIIAENKFVSSRVVTAMAFAPQVSQKEKTYAEMEFPTAEYRLLALFRFWNVINYFFPYKDLIGSEWSEILPLYISKFETNKDAVEYQMTVRELAAETHDSHVSVGNANISNAKIGMFTAPVLLHWIENQTIVAKVVDEKPPLKIGDVILKIDGEPIEKRRAILSRIISASTSQALMSGVHFSLLRGTKDSSAKLTVRGGDGKTREVEVARSLPRQDEKLLGALHRSVPIVQILPSGVAYVDLDRLTVAEVDNMFETIKAAPAAIFDMRGYPNGTAWTIAPRLTTKKSPVGALFSRLISAGMNFDDNGNLYSSDYGFQQKLPEAKGDIYAGRVVMLINENAISQAEHTVLFFEAARPDITFIGTPTAGANGDVTRMVLPGNLTISFSGQSVRHADGRQLQRVGVQPTIRVEPTIRGMMEGRDEILDAAIRFLRSNKAKQ